MANLTDALNEARLASNTQAPELLEQIKRVEKILDGLFAEHGANAWWILAEEDTRVSRAAAAVSRYYANEAVVHMEGLSLTLISGSGLFLTVVGSGSMLTASSGGEIVDGALAPLHGSTKDTSFQVEYIPDSGTPDRVDWYINGVLYRNDDINAPYELRYANEPLPIGTDFEGVTEFPDETYPTFRLDPGNAYTITAVDIRGASQTVTSVTVTIVGGTVDPEDPVIYPEGLWTIPTVEGVQPTVMVTLPQGTLGPRTNVAVNPATVTGISWNADTATWRMDRDWDETIHGGYLDFGVSRLDARGHTVLGFKMEMDNRGGTAHAIIQSNTSLRPELGYFEITNPNQYTHNSYLNGHLYCHHYICRGVVADCVKHGNTDITAVHHDAYWTFNPIFATSTSDKHVDGAQIFNNSYADLRRIVIEWNACGTIAGTTGALFTQGTAGMTARDILILNPGGTFRICRPQGNRAQDIDWVQVIGYQQLNNFNDIMTPTHLFHFYNEAQDQVPNVFNNVPGAGLYYDGA